MKIRSNSELIQLSVTPVPRPPQSRASPGSPRLDTPVRTGSGSPAHFCAPVVFTLRSEVPGTLESELSPRPKTRTFGPNDNLLTGVVE